ncbi:hypothetical protein F4810DRAFT_712591 [Camillea tinctor]|nr:hypothetical protein F4810DRAFT_712591 [Camillea tinctor]
MPVSTFAYILLRVAAQVGLEPTHSSPSSSSRGFSISWIPMSPSSEPKAKENRSRNLTRTNSLSMMAFHVLFAVVVALLASAHHIITRESETMPGAEVCVSHDSPNPLAQQHPNLISGTLNGTTLIVPIPLSRARELIPSNYSISEAAYRSLLPSFPAGMYPMVAQIVHDHDIQFPAYNASLPDFSRASFEFPFIDVLGTGHSSFRYVAAMLISASNPLAIEGSRTYGMSADAASFDPPCDAYAARGGSATTHAHAASYPSGDAYMTLETEASNDGGAQYPLAFIADVVNQPVFGGDAQKCDYYRRVFDAGLAPPVPVRGSVRAAALQPFQGVESWEAGVGGWRLATGFLEPPQTEVCR